MERFDRVVSLGQQVWGSLKPAEREAYYNNDGTIAFVCNILMMLHIEVDELTQAEFTHIHNSILGTVTTKVYGMYAPDHDITFIVEDHLDADGNVIRRECKGFYHGEPSPLDNETYYNDLVAEYND